MKRYLYILGGIIVLAAIAVLGLYLWKSYSSGASSTAQTGTTGTLPSAGTQGSDNGAGGQNQNGASGNATTTTTSNSGTGSLVVAGSFGPLSTDPILNYFTGPNNSVSVVETNSVIGQIAGGQTSYLSSSTLSNVISGGFSYNGEKSLVSFGDPNDPQSSVFDMTTKTWTSLPRGMQSPAWSPSDYRIAYLTPGATGTEILATIDASNIKKPPVVLLTLHANDLTVQWVNKNQFILEDKPSVYAPGSGLVFDAQAQALTPISLALPGLESIWSTATTVIPSEGLIFSANNSGAGGNLQLDDISGDTLQNLTIATLPSKCGFGITTSTASQTSSGNGTTTAPTTASSTSYLNLYCGIPRNTTAFSSARLPDDYEQLALFTSDDIYSINTETGAINIIWNDQSQNVDVSNLQVLGNSLFFINRYNNELYSLTFQN